MTFERESKELIHHSLVGEAEGFFFFLNKEEQVKTTKPPPNDIGELSL